MAEGFNPDSIDSVLTRILSSQEEMAKNLNEHISATQMFRRDLDVRMTAMGERITKVEAATEANAKDIAKVDGNQKKMVAAAGAVATLGGTAGGGWLAKLFGGQ